MSVNQVESLFQALQDDDVRVCRKAAEALGNIGSDVAIKGLLGVLQDEDSFVLSMATELLREFSIYSAEAAALRERYSLARQAAAESLGKIGSEAVIEDLLKVLQEDPDSFVRLSAAKALGKIGSEAAVEGLLEILQKDSNSLVRWKTAEALGKIGSDVAVEGLLQVLHDPDPLVCWAAAGALVEIDSDTAIEGLLKTLQDSNYDVRQLVDGGRGKIGSVLQYQDHLARQKTAEAYGKSGSEASVQDLIKILQDQDAHVRQRAAKALGKIGSGVAIAPLWQARLKQPEPDEWTIGPAIAAIQSRCGFYNYDLYQQAQELEKNLNMSGSDNDSLCGVHKKLDSIESKVDAMSDEPKRVIHTKKYFEKVETYNENNYASDPKFSESLTEILRILETLQQQNPTATTEQANAIIEAEFREIQLHQPDRWKLLRQQLLNRERWFNGGKSALVEAAQSLSNTIGLNVLIAFLDGFSADD